MTKKDQRTKGFQILSLLTRGDVRNDSWQSLYSIPGAHWTGDELINELRKATRILWRDPFFKNLKKWGFTMMTLIGERASQTFLAICHKRWKRHGSPSVGAAGDKNNREAYCKDLRKTFDRFACQHLHGQWTGGADKTLIDEIIKAGPDEDGNYSDVESAPNSIDDTGGWHGAISKLVNDGELVAGDDMTNKLKKPVSKSNYNSKMRLILVYHAVLANLDFPSDLEEDEVINIDVEHIIPKNSWNNFLSALDEPDYSEANKTHSLGNLCLLGYNANRSKNNKTLDELGNTVWDQWILDELERLGGVPKDENENFSQPNQFGVLLEKRINFLLTPFTHERRMNVLTNNSDAMYAP